MAVLPPWPSVSLINKTERGVIYRECAVPSVTQPTSGGQEGLLVKGLPDTKPALYAMTRACPRFRRTLSETTAHIHSLFSVPCANKSSWSFLCC